jgi:4-nitrophenyl phosphatase
VREAGIIVVNADESGLVRPESTSNPDAVVVGICKSFHYDLLSAAMQHIRSGSTFIATNSDTTYPLEGNRLIPGAGSLVAAIQACSGQTPEVLGKPNPLLIQQILAEVKVSPEQCLVVGDRLDTDIEAGRRAGCPCHLVLTGVTDTIPNPLAPEITWSQDLSTLPTLLE